MSKISANILIVDDNEEILLSLRLFLNRYFERIVIQKNPNLVPSMVRSNNFDVIILDMNFTAGTSSGNEGLYWMNRIHEDDPSAVVIFITAFGDIDLAVKAIKEGAVDFIQKPWNEEKLLATVHTAVTLRRSKLEIRNLRYKQQHLNESMERDFFLVPGASEKMKKIMAMVNKIAGTDANVLVTGENGTGKELIAREIHKKSLRKNEVFVSIDMNTLSDALFESEMFGHVSGAFTDAREDRPGRFEIASGGTLFLDEIGNLPMHLQSKLLNVLQNREVSRVGSARLMPVDIRLICATNMDLMNLSNAGVFRKDLLYRINTIQIEVPPLRERKADIRSLANHFLDYYSRKYGKKDLVFSKAALNRMESFDWPGNVRELQHTVEKVVILSEDNRINASDLFTITSGKVGRTSGLNLGENEKYLVLKAIEVNNGNLAMSARELGISRKTLYNKLGKYGVKSTNLPGS